MEIKVYGSQSCGMCKMLLAKLNSKQIAYSYTMDELEVFNASKESGLLSLPIAKIDDKYYDLITTAKVLGL